MNLYNEQTGIRLNDDVTISIIGKYEGDTIPNNFIRDMMRESCYYALYNILTRGSTTYKEILNIMESGTMSSFIKGEDAARNDILKEISKWESQRYVKLVNLFIHNFDDSIDIYYPCRLYKNTHVNRYCVSYEIDGDIRVFNVSSNENSICGCTLWSNTYDHNDGSTVLELFRNYFNIVKEKNEDIIKQISTDCNTIVPSNEKMDDIQNEINNEYIFKDDMKKLIDQFDKDKVRLKQNFPELYYYILAIKDDWKYI